MIKKVINITKRLYKYKINFFILILILNKYNLHIFNFSYLIKKFIVDLNGSNIIENSIVERRSIVFKKKINVKSFDTFYN